MRGLFRKPSHSAVVNRACVFCFEIVTMSLRIWPTIFFQQFKVESSFCVKDFQQEFTFIELKLKKTHQNVKLKYSAN